MEQRESYQNSLAAKEELIKERDEKIQSLVNEIEQNKKIWQTEKKTPVSYTHLTLPTTSRV